MTTVPNFSHATWRKSTFSSGQGGDCIEVADGFAGVVPVRDSKDPSGPTLAFSTAAWSAFVAGIKSGSFPKA